LQIFSVIGAVSLLILCGQVQAQTTFRFGSSKDTTQEIAPQDIPPYRPYLNPQHAGYSDVIKTRYRNLIVPTDFSLIDDWGAMLRFHDDHITGRHGDERRGAKYSDTNVDQCVHDLSTTVTMTSVPTGQELPWAAAKCHAMISQRFNNAPRDAVDQYRQILLYWQQNGVLEDAMSTLQAQRRDRGDYDYALRSSVAKMMAHYAVYHRLYRFEPNEHRKIDTMFSRFSNRYRYYTAYDGRGSHFETLCDIDRPKTPRGTNDHCGSINTRVAVGATLYGLEFANQVVFDHGIRSVEIMLATFDKHAMYTSQIGRGMQGLSYADQIRPAIDQLDFALQKAFGIDFVNEQNIHGVTPGEVYVRLLAVANDPKLMLPYYRSDRDHTASYEGQFLGLIDEIEAGNEHPRVVWEAFNLARYFHTSPGLAKEFHPELWQSYEQQVQDWVYDFGMLFTGFSIRALRLATDSEGRSS